MYCFSIKMFPLLKYVRNLHFLTRSQDLFPIWGWWFSQNSFLRPVHQIYLLVLKKHPNAALMNHHWTKKKEKGLIGFWYLGSWRLYCVPVVMTTRYLSSLRCCQLVLSACYTLGKKLKWGSIWNLGFLTQLKRTFYAKKVLYVLNDCICLRAV